MNWLEQPRGFHDPAYYADAESEPERQLRADYAKYYTLRGIARYGEGPEGVAHLNGLADQAAATWRDHETPQWRMVWEGLEAATTVWEARPDATRRNFDRISRALAAGELSVDELSWRTLRQAREITGHTDGVAYGSNPDHWRSPGPQLRLITNTPEAEPAATPRAETVDSTATLSAVDRTLGARPGEKLVSLAEVDRVITGTDALLGWEESDAALVPAQQRDARISHDYTEIADRQAVHAVLLRNVQNLTGEHTRLSEDWSASAEERQGHIQRLERLLAGIRAARVDALEAGVGPADVDVAYQTGLQGISWSQQPADPYLGQIEQLTAQRDDALAESARLRETVEDLRRQLNGHGTGAEFDTAPALSTGVSASSAIGIDEGGAVIEAAIDAALPHGDSPEWDARSGTDELEPGQSAEPSQELNL